MQTPLFGTVTSQFELFVSHFTVPVTLQTQVGADGVVVSHIGFKRSHPLWGPEDPEINVVVHATHVPVDPQTSAPLPVSHDVPEH